MKLIFTILFTQAILLWNISLCKDTNDDTISNQVTNENVLNEYNLDSSENSIKSKRLSPFYKRNDKKFKPIVYDGYSLDINVDIFKSVRRCNLNEICKVRQRYYFECVCPMNTLCVGHGRNFEAKCSSSLLPYIWIQTGEDMSNIKPKL